VKEAYVIELNQQDWPKPENGQVILKVPVSSDPSRIFAGWGIHRNANSEVVISIKDEVQAILQNNGLIINSVISTEAMMELAELVSQYCYNQ
jgi:hypothetical protein